MFRLRSGACILTRFAATSYVTPIAKSFLSLRASGGVKCVLQRKRLIVVSTMCEAWKFFRRILAEANLGVGPGEFCVEPFSATQVAPCVTFSQITAGYRDGLVVRISRRYKAGWMLHITGREVQIIVLIGFRRAVSHVAK